MDIYQKFLQESFHSPEDLLKSHPKEKEILLAIKQLRIWDYLKLHHVELVGTQPLFIDIDTSDIDLLCYSENLEDFANKTLSFFESKDQLKISQGQSRGKNYVTLNFQNSDFVFEIFVQTTPSRKQDAFKHMIVEGQFLYFAGSSAVESIKKEKMNGLKTEPAFAKVFNLKGDPYTSLLDLYGFPEKIKNITSTHT